MINSVVVIGGGVAGMEAAGMLAKSGCFVTLLDKNEGGGHVRNWHHLFPDRNDADEVVNHLSKQVDNKNILFLKGVSVVDVSRQSNRFKVKTTNGADIDSDAVVVATGYDLFKSERKEEYGYGIYDNVITSADLEKKFRLGDLNTVGGELPKRVGFVHCVGSRDEKSGNIYCSKLCCVTAVKQAVELKEHLPESKVFCFYMDMRMGGAYYEELYMESQIKHGVNFIRGKVSEVGESFDKTLIVKVEDTLVGRPLRIELDMLVLMAGMVMSEGGKEIAGIMGLETGDNNFFKSINQHYKSNISNIGGVFYAGSCTAPMSITETISHARSAAFEVLEYLKKQEIYE